MKHFSIQNRPVGRGLTSAVGWTLAASLLAALGCLGESEVWDGKDASVDSAATDQAAVDHRAGAESPVKHVEGSVVDLPLEEPVDRFTLEFPLSVADAYAAIPHRRTRFNFVQSPMDAEHAEYLATSFHFLDEATRARVTAYQDFYHRGRSATRPVEQLGTVIATFRRLNPPQDLREYNALIVSALEDQREVLAEWAAEGDDFPYRDTIGRHPRVQSASNALKAAYGLLMKEFGGRESAHNRDAFFDYHCALDFL